MQGLLQTWHLMLTASAVNVPLTQVRKQTQKAYVTRRVMLGQEVAAPCESDVYMLSRGPLSGHDNLIMYKPRLCCSLFADG